MRQPLRGLVGQSMSGARPRSLPTLIDYKETTTATSGSYTASVDCWVLLYAWGGGGSGAADTATAAGGGGAGAGYLRYRLGRGRTIAWSVGAGGAGVTGNVDGNDGATTTVTLPNGQVLTAGGGAKGLRLTGGSGGACVGPWTVSRSGGAGGASAAGGSPTGGGTGGALSGSYGGGGGAAGFSDLNPGLPLGNGSAGNGGGASVAGTSPGGGSGGCLNASTSGNGGTGRVLAYIVHIT